MFRAALDHDHSHELKPKCTCKHTWHEDGTVSPLVAPGSSNIRSITRTFIVSRAYVDVSRGMHHMMNSSRPSPTYVGVKGRGGRRPGYTRLAFVAFRLSGDTSVPEVLVVNTNVYVYKFICTREPSILLLISLHHAQRLQFLPQ